ncbi:glycosyltransferase family 4 protein [Puia sp.]|uniref:glycosyltransferase family 4 protein n=1 Tax=Puia sp. TaxID=2045100 RepID=UPI002F403912
MEKKRILVFIGASYVSGLEISTLHLLHGLKRDGHDVRCVVNGWNDGVFRQKLDEAGIPWWQPKVGWLYIRKPLWTLDSLQHWPRAYRECKRILETFDPQVCHFSSFTTALMIYPLLKGRNCVYNLQEPRERNRKHLFIYGLLNKRFKIFTTVSRRIVSMLEGLDIPKEKIRLIYNGVPALENVVATRPAGEAVVFAIVGQIVPWKGHDTLVEAVERLMGHAPVPFVVYIFGNDQNEYSRRLKATIEVKGLTQLFEWKGFVREQAEIYRQTDVIIVPSLSEEPCSLTILEAMMRKKGLIVSDRGGNPELVTHGETGMIFAAGNPADLALCMQYLLGDAALIEKMGEKAGRKALEAFTETRMTQEYEKVYAEL